eukprot:TRINITY_DN2931_c0_g1_i1.p1 TRINITY_DN2931_c0_g1~~TRINITY_DN2931_c0_g1_i1.p1  ORF type:complete len:138 (-),score=27.84 TRINITY_DN2931_c0_g1_i1:135-548(-)
MEKQIINDPQIEQTWAITAMRQAETYFNLLSVTDPKHLRLTPHDDDIYENFRYEFPQLSVNVLNEVDLKSEPSKEKWRPFLMGYEHKVHDYNFATLLRLDASGEYTEENTIVVPRTQFYAIEIARNREGVNKKRIKS